MSSASSPPSPPTATETSVSTRSRPRPTRPTNGSIGTAGLHGPDNAARGQAQARQEIEVRVIRHGIEEGGDDKRDQTDADAAGDHRDLAKTRALGRDLGASGGPDAHGKKRRIEPEADQTQLDGDLQIDVMDGLKRGAPHF